MSGQRLGSSQGYLSKSARFKCTQHDGLCVKTRGSRRCEEASEQMPAPEIIKTDPSALPEQMTPSHFHHSEVPAMPSHSVVVKDQSEM